MNSHNNIQDIIFYLIMIILTFDFIIRGYKIIRGREEILLIPFEILLLCIRVLFGRDQEIKRRKIIVKSINNRRYGYYAFYGGLLYLFTFLFIIFNKIRAF